MAKIRLDKWLWQARFFKTRSICARAVSEGNVRINARKTCKPGRFVAAGDVLTLVRGKRIDVVRIEALGSRRGSATEAQQLYTELAAE
ncbi:MAG: RNA-binding S4 domain-containing protein [Aestuariivita sp.]|nr:RNA-binding S4 domain-containing protein [Aestuariivita sp.]MCY4345764.1 RNA-binding S4 domain-containing protein [Aestuariivita sp.]